jgi:hypothetical protein
LSVLLLGGEGVQMVEAREALRALREPPLDVVEVAPGL